ncbi:MULTISPECIES: MerR family transcriptional regulator [unclassified Microcoleus]|uniref:MerR family transcriptional regulator n=1 Tax=unclassified Microcoleus TaxID=2642155 RepID=UPI002FD4CA8C
MKSANCEHFRTKSEVLTELGICETTLRNYRKLLTDSAPEEFHHQKHEKIYTPESFAALERVAQLFRRGLSKQQVKNTLIKEGV